VVVLVASCAAGGLWSYSRTRSLSAEDITHYVTDSDQLIRVRGRVISEPVVKLRPEHTFSKWTFGSERTGFLLAVDSIEATHGFVQAEGILRASVGEVVLDLHEDHRVELFGWMRKLKPTMNPGAFDWSAYQQRLGVRATLICDFNENVNHLDGSELSSRSFLSHMRRAASRILLDDSIVHGDEHFGLLEAMVLGQRSKTSKSVNDAFLRSGCAHLLAVSGLHVAIPLSFVWFILRFFGVRQARSALVMLVALLAYAAIVEPRPPVLRATVMGTLF